MTPATPKFTPGPWKAEATPKGNWNVYPRCAPIPYICGLYHAEPDIHGRNPESEANAALIAAAPELYEALRMALTWWDDGAHDEQLDRDAVVKALAKATGGAR